MLEANQRLLRKVCWAYARTPEERDDLFQEIVTRLFSASSGYDPARPLSTWLYRVALNVAIDSLRKRRQRGKVQLGLDADREPATRQDPLLAERLEELRALLEERTEVDRALLVLHLEGNSHREIAEILGLSESNVGTRLHRLKDALRQAVIASQSCTIERFSCPSTTCKEPGANSTGSSNAR
jgi:RNA polymerase sigma-70 factor (ECF subfamily)